MAKKLVSEQSIIDAAKRGEKTIQVDGTIIVTAAARDRAKQLGIRFAKQQVEHSIPSASSPSTRGSKKEDKIAIGSDHGGFMLKEALKPFLDSLGYTVVDLGTCSEEACDYPDFAYAVARSVSMGEATRGIMIDSVGIASAIVANKLRGARAVCCSDEFSARSSREHNDANVLTLGGKVVGTELAKSIAKVWLETSFSGGRHQRRVDKIGEIEKRSP